MKLKITSIAILALAIAFSFDIAGANAEEGSKNPLRIKAENRVEERKDMRKDIRASTTAQIKDMRGEFKKERNELHRDIKASSTEMFKKMKDDKKEMVKKMQKNSFEMRKDSLVKHLRLTLENLINIKGRISERITKAETAGRDMTDAKASLTIATDKISKAKIAIDTFANTNFTATSTSSTASTTAEVDLEKPRKLGDAAIKAVKEARDALKKVIQDIAHNMGRGEDGRNATSTPTATTTATTTTN